MDEPEINKLIDKFERKSGGLFKNYQIMSWQCYDSNGKVDQGAIFNWMNEQLRIVLHCQLNEISDKKLCELLIEAFYGFDTTNDGEHPLNKSWSDMQFPVYSALLVAFIAKQMELRFKKLDEPRMEEKYAHIHTAFDLHASEVLNEAYLKDYSKSFQVLCFDYQDKATSTGEDSKYRYTSFLMDIARKAKAIYFLASKCCQREIEKRWKTQFRCSKFEFTLGIFGVVLGIRSHHTLPFVHFNETMKYSERMRAFYLSPCFRYFSHNVAHFVFVVYFSFFLVGRFQENKWLVGILACWMFSFIVEMGMDYWTTTKGYYGMDKLIVFARSNKATTSQTFFIMLSFILFLLGIVGVEGPFPWFRGVCGVSLYVTYCIAALRLLKLTVINKDLGNVFGIVTKIMPQVFYFTVIFGCFWLVFAVGIIFLQGANDEHWAWRIFQTGAFEIFGEPLDDLRNGMSFGCSNKSHFNQTTDTTVQCFIARWCIPITLLIYLLVSSILLINILTAFLNLEFEKAKEKAHLKWRYYLYKRLVEYENKQWFPAPLWMLNLPSFCCGKKGNSGSKYVYENIEEIRPRKPSEQQLVRHSTQDEQELLNFIKNCQRKYLIKSGTADIDPLQEPIGSLTSTRDTTARFE